MRTTRRLNGWSTRRWLISGVAVFLAILVALAGAGAWSLGHAQSVTNRLIHSNAPALLTSERLENALLDEETGTRGYGITGRRDFLRPYQQGIAAQRTDTARLRALLAGDPHALGDLDLVTARATAWQRALAAPVAAAAPDRATAVASARAARGRTAFDALRTAMTAQQNHLTGERTTTLADLGSARTLRDVAFGGIFAVIVIMAALILEGLRRGVATPLTSLSRQVRAVATGDFDTPITASGPADLRALGHDVENMRDRLARSLRSSADAAATLDRQATDLRRSNEELEQFAYVASHDLQEPLRKVASFCQLLQRRYAEQLDDRANQYIAFAVDGAQRMQTLINDLLSFSRVGRLHNDHRPVDLETVWNETAEALSIAVQESGAVLTHDPLPTVLGDRTQLGMLVQNLLTNALKFRAPDRPPAITLTARRTGERWTFALTDNGIGIAAEYAERIFIIFQRLHTREVYTGNGIGLAMCKKITEYHGGAIALDPSHTPGARFVFTLPAVTDGPSGTEDEVTAR